MERNSTMHVREDVFQDLPEVDSVLAVCAHPDDESFGLGAVLSAFAERGVRTSVLCLTHGEASTLGADMGDLHVIRERELSSAAAALGVGGVRLLEFGDGRVAEAPIDELCAEVRLAVEQEGADLLLVFDEGGITGHSDHMMATYAARAVGEEDELPVLAWTLAAEVADQLGTEFPVEFVGRGSDAIHLSIEVDRTRQHQAIHCHASQASENPVLWRRLELQGDREVLRWLDPAEQGRPR
jgi:LmbE family N-acetylglucosaminyl deacetylase